ncbi:hypothetical protein HHK36_030781 [Tetracentron sinense]|uniref:C2H2-type domain-containing protein n=1 Tax=Tetracentron sinense TaxID=13715 RepID=A0A834YA65_TETSI|nr:hypothetical protein HHK36_030781 [Tetracentron sinense]
MGFVFLLNLMVKIFDVLAWPLITLVYPLKILNVFSPLAVPFASPSGGKKVTESLILFMLSLHGRLPFWPYVKFMAACYLVVPHLEGAAYVYDHFLRPCFPMTMQALNNWFIQLKENFLFSRSDNFLDAAERYIKDNGHEALEKLIISKSKYEEPNLSRTENKEVVTTENKEAAATKRSKCNESKLARTEIKAVLTTENKEAAATEWSKCEEPNLARTKIKAVVTMENKEAAATEWSKCEEPNLARTEVKAVVTRENKVAAATKSVKIVEPNPTWTEKETCTAMKDREITEAVAKDRGIGLPNLPAPNDVKKEWTCGICQVTASCKENIKDHYRGKKHRAKQQELKESKLAAKIQDSLAATAKKDDHPKVKPKKSVSTNEPNPKHFKKQEVKVNGTGEQSKQNQKQQLALWRLPFWPSVKLMAACCLVVPHLDGAAYVYDHFLRPCFTMTMQALNNWFLQSKKDFLFCRSDNFLDAAERYIKENGHEALEKLIISKSKCKEPNLAQTEIKALVTTENKEAAETEWSKCKEPNLAQTEIKALVTTENKEATETEWSKCEEPNLSRTNIKAVVTTEYKEAATTKLSKCEEPNLAQSKIKAVVTTENKEATVSEWVKSVEPNPAWTEKEACTAMQGNEITVAVAEDRGIERTNLPALKDVRKEWRCALCQVSVSSEEILKEHFRGKKHQAKLKKLKASEMEAKSNGSSTSTAEKDDQPKVEPKKGVSANMVAKRPGFQNQNHLNGDYQWQGFNQHQPLGFANANGPVGFTGFNDFQHHPQGDANGLYGYFETPPLPHRHPYPTAIFNPTSPFPDHMLPEAYTPLHCYPGHVPVPVPHAQVISGPALYPQPQQSYN